MYAFLDPLTSKWTLSILQGWSNNNRLKRLHVFLINFRISPIPILLGSFPRNAEEYRDPSFKALFSVICINLSKNDGFNSAELDVAFASSLAAT